MKKIMVMILAIILFLSLIPVSSACTIKQVFENIVISSGIEEDTNEPLNENIEFEASAEHIYATIKFTGVKGGDNWRFKWTNLDTGETVLDKEDQYNKDQEERYVEGIVETDIFPLDTSSLIPAGDYKVEFYNNGELVKTTTFKVNKPEVSIIEVLLANQVDQNFVPVSITQEFKSNETVYACVQVNYQTAGNFLKAQWKSSVDELIWEDSIELAEFSSPSYITFWFPPETESITAGSYKVEIYLNDILYGSFDFEVTEEVAEATVTFDQGNEYSATDFGFTITLPDNWTYEENKTEQEDIVTILPPYQDTPVWLQFSAVDPELYVPFGDFADNDSAGFAEQQDWTFVEKIESDSTLQNGAPCKEYSYLFTDDDNINWIMGYGFAENNGTLYILIVITDKINSSMAIDAYVGILNSLIFG
ncbi:MAG TPA: hypothetical protein VIH07_05135 [Candidatus Humimicrobiaceae bacterium]